MIEILPELPTFNEFGISLYERIKINLKMVNMNIYSCKIGPLPD